MELGRRGVLTGIAGCGLAAVAGCLGGGSSGETIEREEAQSLLEAYFDAVTTGDAEAVAALRHPEAPPVPQQELDILAETEYQLESVEVEDAEGDRSAVQGRVILTRDGNQVQETEFDVQVSFVDGEWVIGSPEGDGGPVAE